MLEVILQNATECGLIEGWAKCPGVTIWDIELNDGSWMQIGEPYGRNAEGVRANV